MIPLEYNLEFLGVHMSQSTFSTTYTRILARTLGLKRDATRPLLKGTDFEPEDIEFERRELSCEDQYQIISNALQLVKGAGLGLRVGEQAELSMHGMLGLAAMTSATLHEALVMFAKYHYLRAPFFSMRLVPKDADLMIVMENVDELPVPVAGFLLESYAAMMQSMIEYILGRTVPEARLLLPQFMLKNWPLYQEYFHCPIESAGDHTIRYIIPLSLVNSPCLTRDDTLHKRAEDGCKNLLENIDGQATFRGKVEELFAVGNGTFLTQEECAQLLHVSSRTLIRKLKKEGVSYQGLLEEKQKALAVNLLDETSVTIEAIALNLGYEHASNFRRAFKRWFGMTPSQYRKALIQAK